ncbi:MAG: TonB-dependent receptor [Maricaulaceae bacterium]
MLSRHSLRSRLIISASLLTLPVGLTTGFSSVASAQVVDEIIVTATRRAESIQDIPVNISAVGGEQIAEQGFGDISELAAFVPGLNIADQGGRDGNRIVVRGLNAEPVENAVGQENGGGTVATYVGEIPLFVDLRLNDLQRVEVLLGPQGTLYGAGTLGGAIRYIPNKPDFSGQLFEVRTGVYSYTGGSGISHDTGFTFNLPVSDSFAVRGSLDFQNDQGFIDNPFIVRGIGVSEPDPDFSNATEVSDNLVRIEDANTEEIFSGRIAARWQPNDALDATLTYYFQEGDFGGRNASSFRTDNIPSEEFEFGTRVPEPNERNSDLLSLEVTADLGFAELTSATGYATVEENGQRDQTDLLISLEYSYETFPTFTAFTFEDEETEIFSQELRLVSTGDGPLNWIVGGFYNQNEFNNLTSEFTPGFGVFADFDRQDLNDLEFFQADRNHLEEKAVFGEIGYDITEAWSVTGGIRVYDFDLETANLTEFPFFTDAASFNPFPLSDIENQLTLAENQSGSGTLFKFNTAYKFGGGNTVYATFSQGFRVGRSNSGATCTDADIAAFASGADPEQGLCLFLPGQQFSADPADIAVLDENGAEDDTTDNYEIGFKTTWLDGAVRLNGAVFFVEWNDPQVSATSINAGVPITVNAESAESKGFELDGSWRVTDRFNLRGNFSFTDAELTADVPGLVTTINAPGFGTTIEAGQDGDRLPGSPRTQFSVFGDYEHPLSNGNALIVNGGYSWQGDVLSFVGERGGSFTLPSFGRANVSVGYKADNWDFTLYSDNIFNDFSETSARDTPLFNQTVPAFDGDTNPSNVRSFFTNVLPPRSFGARFKYRFE